MKTLIALRKVPIDFAAVAMESGLTSGKIGRSVAFDCWGVFNENGIPGPDFAQITPPPLQDGETEIRICGRWWTFFGPEQ